LENEKLNTKEFAELTRVDAGTIRRSYCINGHYLGLKPIKLQTGRLLWPKDDALRVVWGIGGRKEKGE
jgi:hypothetical protein